LNKSHIYSPDDVDVIVGGPPCQGFSRNGARKYVTLDQQRSRFYDDPRNHLYKAFLQVLEEIAPKLVLIENVREFLNFGEGKFSSDLLAKLRELGYVAKFQKVCAADYGVPQLRHRVFFVAIRKQLVDELGMPIPFPQPTFINTDQLPLFNKTRG